MLSQHTAPAPVAFAIPVADTLPADTPAPQVVRHIRTRRAEYGRSEVGRGRSVQIEFVSANPNTPLHLAHGRAAVLGDALATLLEWTGWRVTREFYVNDVTSAPQLALLGRALYARYCQACGLPAELPQEGYIGEYVAEIARGIAARDGDRHLAGTHEEIAARFAGLALEEMLARQQAELRALGVHHDVWFRESSLHASGAVADTIALLTERGWTYESEGALWFRSTAFGDDADRVLVRASGSPTYLAADAAYHRNKHQRGFDRVVDVWRSDHSAYVARTQAVVQALGLPPNWLTIVIHQPASLARDDEVVLTSKRGGEGVLLADVLDELGKAATRFWLVRYPAGSPVVLDIGVVRAQDEANPLAAIQGACARMTEILQGAQAKGVAAPPPDQLPASLESEPERRLAATLARFPHEVAEAAESLQPDRIARFAEELASVFWTFDRATAAHGNGAEPGGGATCLALADAAHTVLTNALRILGLAPEDDHP